MRHPLTAGAVAAAIAAVASAPSVAATVDLTDASTTLSIAEKASTWMTYYFSYYDWTAEDGAWDQSIVQWHESGIYLNSILKYMKYSGDYSLVDFVSTSMYYATQDGGDLLFGCSGNCGGKWNDDIGWWALATMSGADLFGETSLISSSAGSSTTWFYVANFTLYEMLQDYDTVCGGGVYWSRDRTSTSTNLKYEKSAITNAQIIWLATRLYLFVGDTTYLNLATSFYTWFVANTTASNFMIYDGVYALSDTDCEVSGETWSYYYGIMAAYGAVLTNITGDSTYITNGMQYYDYWKNNFVNASGHFFEPWCASTSCKDPTGFNFPVYESLAVLYNALPSSTYESTQAEIKSLMATQGAYLIDHLECDQSTWLCVRTLDPVPSEYTYSNGTNPRDQLEILSFLNAMVSINGAPVASSTPTAAAVVATTSIKAGAYRAVAVSPLASAAFAAVASVLAIAAAVACVAL
ncbi:hydrolase 76 protein [Cladochytrium tenue]|nr:hydrolase 76 protein [Cladochytrium tenue]